VKKFTRSGTSAHTFKRGRKRAFPDVIVLTIRSDRDAKKRASQHLEGRTRAKHDTYCDLRVL
jgi:hypothetical protein